MEIDEAVRRVRAGELEAYDEVVRSCQGALRSFIAAYCPDPGQVDDIAQRAFVWAYEHLDDYRLGTRFYAWLKTVARNTLLSELERLRREAAGKRNYLQHLQAVHAHTSLSEGEDETADRLRACVDRLPEHTRRLLRDRYEERKPVEAIARDSGRDLAAVKSALFRLRQALRRCVEGHVAGELT